ncbi:MAG: amidohydrolase family protein [Terriglobia bacterium]
MRVDSHQHFWQVNRGDYFWMSPAVPILHRDYCPEDLKPSLAKHQIDKTILVQAAPTAAETDFLLDLAQRNDFVAGVVGWLDPEQNDFAERFAIYRQKPKLIGIRPMLQDLPEDDYIVKPRVVESLKLIAESGFAFDFLTYPRHLTYVLRVLDKVPNLHAVVDHISKPEIKTQKIEPWKSLIRDVAQHTNIYCKLSGMITEADHATWTPDQLRPYVEHVVECFGLERVMFGSDWPVCLQAGSYDQAIEALCTILAPVLNKTSEAAVFGSNAARFYRID